MCPVQIYKVTLLESSWSIKYRLLSDDGRVELQEQWVKQLSKSKTNKKKTLRSLRNNANVCLSLSPPHACSFLLRHQPLWSATRHPPITWSPKGLCPQPTCLPHVLHCTCLCRWSPPGSAVHVRRLTPFPEKPGRATGTLSGGSVPLLALPVNLKEVS